MNWSYPEISDRPESRVRFRWNPERKARRKGRREKPCKISRSRRRGRTCRSVFSCKANLERRAETRQCDLSARAGEGSSTVAAVYDLQQSSNLYDITRP